MQISQMSAACLCLLFLAPCSGISAFGQNGAATPPPNLGGPEAMAEMARLRSMPDLPGDGPFASVYESVPGKEIVVYHPSDLVAATKVRPLGIYLWGNGGCGTDAASARFHLLDMASHGYVVVVPGRIGSGPQAPKNAQATSERPPAPPPVTAAGVPAGVMVVDIGPEKMEAALNWVLAENARPGSPYFSKLDPHRVAVSGHSCGGLLSIKLGLDPRVRAVIAEDSGVWPDKGNPLPFVKKADLDALHTPILYITGGPSDIAQPNALADYAAIHKVTVMLADRPGTGHMGSFARPGGEGTGVELNWLAWQLDGDESAAHVFVGPDCGLCRDPAWQLYRKVVP